jgi:hypothetical protein
MDKNIEADGSCGQLSNWLVKASEKVNFDSSCQEIGPYIRDCLIDAQHRSGKQGWHHSRNVSTSPQEMN